MLVDMQSCMQWKALKTHFLGVWHEDDISRTGSKKRVLIKWRCAICDFPRREGKLMTELMKHKRSTS
jgi:hypothetical protein